jgi:pimeloyl-ACP methyl ester carboxylesterase
MTTFVFAAGGWHGGWCWKRVAGPLRAQGHEVFTPTYTGVGERVHLANRDITLETHIADVRGTLEWEDLHDVVLVGHSYGGMIVTALADRVPERLASLVYLDALWPKDGESVHDVIGAVAQDRLAEAAADEEHTVHIPMPVETAMFMGATDPDDIAWLADKLTPQPHTEGDPLHLQHGLSPLPTTYIACTGWSSQGLAQITYVRAREHAAAQPNVRYV